MRKYVNRILVLSLAVVFFVAFIIQPAAAWSDIGVEYSSGTANPGTWYSTENDALEGGTIGSYDFEGIFTITGVDQSADVYKIEIDYNCSDQGADETMVVEYKWGSGSWTHITYLQEDPVNEKYTIADASSTTLYIRISDYTNFLDFLRDRWDFGNEPVLWMYWY